MKKLKLLAITLLIGLLSIPSIVLAESIWYGTIRAGVEYAPFDAFKAGSCDQLTHQYPAGVSKEPWPSVLWRGTCVPKPDWQDARSGVADFRSRWGIKGSAEVDYGLNVVYRYEHKFDSSNSGGHGVRQSYVGVGGGFGTVTLGRQETAHYKHFGGIVDQALYYDVVRDAEKFENALSYAAAISNVSLQADAVFDSEPKKKNVDQFQIQDPNNKDVDAWNFGATIDGIGGTGKIAIAHRRPTNRWQQYTASWSGNWMQYRASKVGQQDRLPDYTMKTSSSFIAGSYAFGGTTVFLGYSEDSTKDPGCTRNSISQDDAGKDNSRNECFWKREVKTTYAGVHGGFGDTGVGYVFTVRAVKDSPTGIGLGDLKPPAVGTVSTKRTPWTLGLSKSLGTGAALKFEYSDPDHEAIKPSAALWLQVDF